MVMHLPFSLTLTLPIATIIGLACLKFLGIKFISSSVSSGEHDLEVEISADCTFNPQFNINKHQVRSLTKNAH